MTSFSNENSLFYLTAFLFNTQRIAIHYSVTTSGVHAQWGCPSILGSITSGFVSFTPQEGHAIP
jgi:hypothetical protein